jgi:flagellar protein FlaG
MANTGARLLLVVASILIVVSVTGAVVGHVHQVSSALEDRGESASDDLQTEVDIVDDPGARQSMYDDATDELTLHVENAGSRTLPAEPGAIDLLVNGEYRTDVDVTVLETSRWQPGAIVRLETTVDLDANETMRVVVRVDDSTDVLVFDAVGGPELPREAIVFTNASGALRSVTTDGTIADYGVTAAVIGPKEIDFDGDDRLEIPYVRPDGTLAIVDSSGDVEPLATGVETNDTLLGVGTWRYETSVFYVNESDGGYVYRVAPGEDPERVFGDGDPIAATAIAGVADVDDDGDADLVYADPSANVTYLDEGVVHDVGQKVGTNWSVGIGAPRTFDGTPPPRVPIVDDGSDVTLLSAANVTTALTTDGDAVQTPVAGIDWTGDGDREVVFVDATTGTLQYVRLDGTIGTITDDDGDPVTANRDAGVA